MITGAGIAWDVSFTGEDGIGRTWGKVRMTGALPKLE